MEKPELTLYYKDTCPYCRKVLNYLYECNRTIPLKDTKHNPENVEELISIGGKKQVPCLIINGEPLYESDAIISWIEQHKTSLESGDIKAHL